MIDFNATTWEAVAVVITAALTGISVVHAFTPRPRLRTFHDRPHEKQEGAWVELGAIVYVVNLGRAPAVIRSAGLRNADGGTTHQQSFPSQLEPNVTPGTTPMVLPPGAMVAYFCTGWPQPGTTEQFGVLELRTWRFARAIARWPEWARRAVPGWAKHKWHPAQGPARPQEHSPNTSGD